MSKITLSVLLVITTAACGVHLTVQDAGLLNKADILSIGSDMYDVRILLVPKSDVSALNHTEIDTTRLNTLFSILNIVTSVCDDRGGDSDMQSSMLEETSLDPELLETTTTNTAAIEVLDVLEAESTTPGYNSDDDMRFEMSDDGSRSTTTTAAVILTQSLGSADGVVAVAGMPVAQTAAVQSGHVIDGYAASGVANDENAPGHVVDRFDKRSSVNESFGRASDEDAKQQTSNIVEEELWDPQNFFEEFVKDVDSVTVYSLKAFRKLLANTIVRKEDEIGGLWSYDNNNRKGLNRYFRFKFDNMEHRYTFRCDYIVKSLYLDPVCRTVDMRVLKNGENEPVIHFMFNRNVYFESLTAAQVRLLKQKKGYILNYVEQ